MTADTVVSIPPYKADDQDVVAELRAQFGDDSFTLQSTRTGMPVLWVARERLIEVLTCLRKLPRPYVMLYDLHGVDERLRTQRRGLPDADFTVFYHLMSLERNSDVMIKVALREGDLNLPSATGIWPNANWYEREPRRTLRRRPGDHRLRWRHHGSVRLRGDDAQPRPGRCRSGTQVADARHLGRSGHSQRPAARAVALRAAQPCQRCPDRPYHGRSQSRWHQPVRPLPAGGGAGLDAAARRPGRRLPPGPP
ncbi:UNVERIFIED_CONTAM: nuoC [Trichonephila clavipes]